MKLSQFSSIINKTLTDSLANPDFSDIYHFESALTVLSIQQHLSKIENNPNEMNSRNASGIVNLLKDRWETIRSTDAMEQYYADSPANQACRTMAKYLFDNRSGPNHNTSKSEILFPGLPKSIETASKRASVYDSKPQSFVLTDDGKDAINIYKCLKEIKTDSFTQDLEPQLHTTNAKENRPLSSDERERVIAHCDATRTYYDAVWKAIKENNLNKEFHDELKSALNDGLKKTEVTYSYGEAGRARLSERMYADIASFNQLVARLSAMPVQYRQPFVKFMPQEKRKALLDSIAKSVMDTYGTLPNKETRTAYCAMYLLYEQDRLTRSYVKSLDTTDKPFFSDMSGNVQHFSARFAGLFFPNRESKSSAAQVVINLLQDDRVTLFDAAYVLSAKGRLPESLDFDESVHEHAKSVHSHSGDIFNKNLGKLSKVLIEQFQESIEQKNQQAQEEKARPDLKKAS